MSNEAQKSPPVIATVDGACTSGAKTEASACTSGMKTEMSSQQKAEKLSAEIKKTWNKLTDDDVKLLESDAAQFFAKIKEKHNLTQDEAQKRLTEIKASGGCTAEKAA